MRKTAPKVVLLSAIILLFLSACTSNSGIFAGGNWQSSGLPHQHIRALAVDFNNPQVIYAASSQGKNFTSNAVSTGSSGVLVYQQTVLSMSFLSILQEKNSMLRPAQAFL